MFWLLLICVPPSFSFLFWAQRVSWHTRLPLLRTTVEGKEREGGYRNYIHQVVSALKSRGGNSMGGKKKVKQES